MLVILIFVDMTVYSEAERQPRIWGEVGSECWVIYTRCIYSTNLNYMVALHVQYNHEAARKREEGSQSPWGSAAGNKVA